MLSQGIPNLNLVYEDEIGTVIDHLHEDKHVIHSELKVEPTASVLKHCKQVSDEIDAAYAARGFNFLYTWGSSEEHDRYNKFLGYRPTGNEFNVEGYGMVKEYRKDLK